MITGQVDANLDALIQLSVQSPGNMLAARVQPENIALPLRK